MSARRKRLTKLSDKLVKDAETTFAKIINELEQWEAELEDRNQNKK